MRDNFSECREDIFHYREPPELLDLVCEVRRDSETPPRSVGVERFRIPEPSARQRVQEQVELPSWVCILCSHRFVPAQEGRVAIRATLRKSIGFECRVIEHLNPINFLGMAGIVAGFPARAGFPGLCGGDDLRFAKSVT